MNSEFLQYIRHLSKEDKKTLSQKVLKIFEEGGELAKVALPFDSAYATNHRFIEREALLEEAVDTVLTAISVAYHLDFTDVEIDQMFHRKAEKWARLQANEKDLKYPVPYEIHITVKATNPRTLDQFKAACHEAEVKPIVIDLKTNNSLRIQTDVMTSSKHFGTNRSAYYAMEWIVVVMEKWGFEVLRKKIETVPWHPAAPRSSADLMPANCYFEAHIPVKFDPLHRDRLMHATQHDEVHISSNAFKKHEDGRETIMITYRSYTDTLGQFETRVERIVHHLTTLGSPWLEVGIPMKEFSIYDTKINHDASWLTTN